jgi:hypothetical protein
LVRPSYPPKCCELGNVPQLLLLFSFSNSHLSFSRSLGCVMLTRWHIHESQFPNMNFLELQILGIINLQIKIEQMFDLAKVLTTLRCCHLQMENMDWIVIVTKDWLGCKPNLNLKYFKTKKSFAKQNYNLIEEHNFFEKIHVDND